MTKPNDRTGTGSARGATAGRHRGSGLQARPKPQGRVQLSGGRLDGIAGGGPTVLNNRITD